MKRLTYANVMSTISCFLALSTGGAYAKATFIDGRNIKADSIHGKSIKNATVDSADLKNGSITAADLKTGSLPASVLSPAAVEELRNGDTPSSTPQSERVVGQPCRFTTLGTQGVWEVATSLTAPVYAGKIICIVRDTSGNYLTGSDEAVTG